MHYGSGVRTRCRDVLASEFKYCSDLNTTRFIKRVIEAENPDFIAFTGTAVFTFQGKSRISYAAADRIKVCFCRG